jgi:hypothetical protein
MILDDECIELHKGVVVYVPRGVKHKAIGNRRSARRARTGIAQIISSLRWRTCGGRLHSAQSP